MKLMIVPQGGSTHAVVLSRAASEMRVIERAADIEVGCKL